MADVEQTQKMILFITCEISCRYVCELVFGVNEFNLDLAIQIDSMNNQEQLFGFWKHFSSLGFVF